MNVITCLIVLLNDQFLFFCKFQLVMMCDWRGNRNWWTDSQKIWIIHHAKVESSKLKVNIARCWAPGTIKMILVFFFPTWLTHFGLLAFTWLSGPDASTFPSLSVVLPVLESVQLQFINGIKKARLEIWINSIRQVRAAIIKVKVKNWS